MTHCDPLHVKLPEVLHLADDVLLVHGILADMVPIERDLTKCTALRQARNVLIAVNKATYCIILLGNRIYMKCYSCTIKDKLIFLYNCVLFNV